MSKTVDIVVSILLGLGISFLFKLCSDSRSCLVYRVPPLEGKVLRYQDTCYTATEKKETCDATKERIHVKSE
jgi:hypothetical protein